MQTRSHEKEWMDGGETFDDELAGASYRFIERVNKCFGGIATVQRFLAREAAEGTLNHAPVRILDVGAGACDIPVPLALWSEKQGLNLQFDCIESAAAACERARRNIKAAGVTSVRVVEQDVFTYKPVVPYDYGVASLFLHHLEERAIVELVEVVRRHTRRGLFVNDLQRSRLGYWCARFLTLFTRQPGVRHDALLSIRKGFLAEELRGILQQPDGVRVAVKPAPWFRLTAYAQWGQE